MVAIMKRELKAYFTSPVGYIYLGVFYFFAGLYFYATSFGTGIASLNGVFSSLFSIVGFTIPILTMRLFSEDKKHKTEQILLTAPISLTAMVCGKYFAAAVMYLLSISITLVFGLVISFFTAPDWAMIIGNFIGIALYGLALIAIGLFISSLTESQVIAAIGGFAVALVLLVIDAVASSLPYPWMVSAANGISFMKHFQNFNVGILDIADIVFFLSVCVMFQFLTVRVFERRRWN